MSAMARISLDEEVRLYTNNMEREKYNLLATLFGIIVSLEYLERAYVRDSITAAEWTALSSAAKNIAKNVHVEIFAGMHTITLPIQDHV